MRVIIAGYRECFDYEKVLKAVHESGFKIDCVISGHATGVDTMGERYAKEHNLPLEIYPADWSKYGKRAGPVRNAIMASKADALIALYNGKSPGTKNMINTAKEKGLQVFILPI